MGTSRKILFAVIAVTALLLVSCTTDEDPGSEDSSSSDDSAPDAGSDATGPAPGVTDDTIKIGIPYVDTEALLAVNLDYNLGDHEAVYNALIDDINANGGINGRQLEAVFAPIDPTGPASADEACLRLTEDEDVFLATGFFLDDAVTCVVGAHSTAVAGGTMTPERLAQAQAPWVTWTPDTDQVTTVINTFDEQSALDGNVAIFAAAADQAVVDDQIVPALAELGVEPVEIGIQDAANDDTAAIESTIALISERFQAADADTVIVVGESGSQWPQYTADDTSYQPTLLFTEYVGALAYTSNAATTDTSNLDGAIAGGSYGPEQPRFDAMEDCIAVLDAAGLDTQTPDEVGTDPSNQPYQAAFQACPDLALTQAWLEAAGENLNYGTLQAAIDAGFEVQIPGEPGTRTFGPEPDLDGAPQAYLFAWDEASSTWESAEG